MSVIINPSSGGGGGGMTIGGAVVGGTPGSVLFIGTGPVLAQDNANFFWDDTNFFLKLGHSGTHGAYYINGVPAIFEVPNANGNNWFEGNAGNTSVTGSGNFGTGDGVLANISSGAGNVGIGGAVPGQFATLGLMNTGSNNMAVGTSALSKNIDGSHNTAIGITALQNTLHDSKNVALGSQCMTNMDAGGGGAGDENIGIGFGVLNALTSGSQNVVIGPQSASNITTGSFNTFIGPFAGFFLTGGSNNTVLGEWEGPSASVFNTVVLSGGADNHMPALDCHFTNTTGWTWSFNTRHGTADNPVGVHVYNTQDTTVPPTNYERGGLDWNLTSNTFRLFSAAGGTGTIRLIAIDGFQKAGAPVAGDLPSGTCALINDTSGNQTWLAYNNAGTIRKVQLT
jgi:hypothetical protein